MNRCEYHVIESFCEEVGIVTYGISAWQRYSRKIVEVCSIEDISPDKRAVLKVAEYCQRVQLSPIHLMDVIEDFLSG